MLVFRCLHVTAALYLARAVSCGGRRKRRLRSASTSALVTPSSRCSMIGDRAFFVARLEQLAIHRHCVTDTRHLQAPAEDTSFRCFPCLTQQYWICAAPVFFVTLTDVQCSWSFFLLNDTYYSAVIRPQGHCESSHERGCVSSASVRRPSRDGSSTPRQFFGTTYTYHSGMTNGVMMVFFSKHEKLPVLPPPCIDEHRILMHQHKFQPPRARTTRDNKEFYPLCCK